MFYRVARCYRRKSFPGLFPQDTVRDMKLTTKTIEALQPTDRRQEIKDDGCRGLYLLVQPSGAEGLGGPLFLDGKVRKATLGSFPKMGLAEARIAAGKIFEQTRRQHRPARGGAAGGGGGEGGADADLRRARATVHRRLRCICASRREHRAACSGR